MACSANDGHKWSKALVRSVSATCLGLAATKSAVASTTDVLALPHHCPVGAAGQFFSKALCHARTSKEAMLMGRLSKIDFLVIPTTFQFQILRIRLFGRSSLLLLEASIQSWYNSSAKGVKWCWSSPPIKTSCP